MSVSHTCMWLELLYMLVFFFFQAEDGIRDTSVTGVQTCALPISARVQDRGPVLQSQRQPDPEVLRELGGVADRIVRSEERRVGKSVDLGGWRIIKKKKYS